MKHSKVEHRVQIIRAALPQENFKTVVQPSKSVFKIAEIKHHSGRGKKKYLYQGILAHLPPVLNPFFQAHAIVYLSGAE